MKVAKKTTTEYRIDLVNQKSTALNVSNAIELLNEHGVKVEDAILTQDGREYVLTVVQNTYYDESTLARMEK